MFFSVFCVVFSCVYYWFWYYIFIPRMLILFIKGMTVMKTCMMLTIVFCAFVLTALADVEHYKEQVVAAKNVDLALNAYKEKWHERISLYHRLNGLHCLGRTICWSARVFQPHGTSGYDDGRIGSATSRCSGCLYRNLLRTTCFFSLLVWVCCVNIQPIGTEGTNLQAGYDCVENLE